MLFSREVRWFSAGEIPDAVWRWVKFGGDPEVETTRVDYYLLGTGETLGIKIRQGLIEVKQRQKSPINVEFSPNAAGQVEIWRKWSFPINEGAEWLEQVVQDGAWLGVHKRRWLKVFGVTQQVERVPLDELPQNGCSWELTELQVEGIEGCWWSVSFEAFGESSRLEDSLNRVVNHVWLPAPEIEFKIPSSFGYPAWIIKIKE